MPCRSLLLLLLLPFAHSFPAQHPGQFPDAVPGLTVAIARPFGPPRDDLHIPEATASEEELQHARHRRSAVNSSATQDASGGEQNFFPSFAPLFPPALFQQPRLRPSAFQPLGPYLRAAPPPPEPAAAAAAPGSLLGSGNFGVIRGGTFYSDDEKPDFLDYGSGESNLFNPYYGNGHGRPPFYNGISNPRPQHDFFANFRDFADINVPTRSSYSEFYVVYANKNATKEETASKQLKPADAKPKNIFEQLTLLDKEPDTPVEDATKNEKSSELSKKKRKDSSKSKLALLQDEKKKKFKKSSSPTVLRADLYEPLLALS